MEHMLRQEWMWLGSGIISFICWGMEKRQALPVLGVDHTFLEGRAREKYRHHRRKSQALLSILIVSASPPLPTPPHPHPHPSPAWTLPTHSTDLSTRGDGIVDVVAAGVLVNFMRQHDWARGWLGVLPDISLHVCEGVSACDSHWNQWDE